MVGDGIEALNQARAQASDMIKRAGKRFRMLSRERAHLLIERRSLQDDEPQPWGSTERNVSMVG